MKAVNVQFQVIAEHEDRSVFELGQYHRKYPTLEV